VARRSDRIITHVRTITENEVANSTTDISDEEILEYINEGLQRILSVIVRENQRVFLKETTINAVQDQEEYDLPSDVFLNSKLVSVEYTTNSAASRPVFYKLRPGIDRQRYTHVSAQPTHYIRRDKFDTDTGSFLASPPPADSNGQFRITYIQKMDNVDKRRAVVSAVTDSGTAITALTLDTSGTPPIDSIALADHEFFCIVDKNGNMKMRNLEFDEDGDTSIDTSTGVVTLEGGSHTYSSGESIAVGDYVVGGKDTGTHLRIPRNLERYVKKFAAFQILKTDSSIDQGEALQELSIIEADISANYRNLEEDEHEIPITDDWSDFGCD